jgi:hypothetical protein
MKLCFFKTLHFFIASPSFFPVLTNLFFLSCFSWCLFFSLSSSFILIAGFSSFPPCFPSSFVFYCFFLFLLAPFSLFFLDVFFLFLLAPLPLYFLAVFISYFLFLFLFFSSLLLFLFFSCCFFL